MSAQREIIVRPLGLITRPNKYGQYPAGAMSTCKNVCMRDKGVLSSLPATQTYKANAATADYLIRRIFPCRESESLLAFGTDSNGTSIDAQWVTGSARTAITLTPTSYSSAPALNPGRVQASQQRGRLTVSTGGSPLVFNIAAQGATVRAAGFPSPIFYPYSFAAGAAVATGTVATWCFVWRRKDSDGYEIISEPSPQIRLWNASGSTVNPSFKTHLGVQGFDIAAGDYLDCYRTDSVTAIDSETDPGQVFYLRFSHVVTAAEISATYATITDPSPDTSRGQELYTNPGAAVPDIVGVGADYLNSPPGLSRDTFVYKGQTFYQVAALAPFRVLRSVYWGTLSSVEQRTNGIGTRSFTGTATSGSPIITGISATDILGLAVGQELTGNGGKFGSGKYISTVTANSVTISANATGTGSASFTSQDTITYSGVAYRMGSAYDLLYGLQNPFVLQSDKAFYFGKLTGLSFTLDSTQVVNGIEIVIRAPRYQDGLTTPTLAATNPQNYQLPLPASSAESLGYDSRENRLQWSKPEQPEAVPPLQELMYGHGNHLRGVPTRDAVFLFATDGLYRLSGQQDDYRVDPYDLTIVLAARNAVDVLGDTIYAYTNKGLVAISDGSPVKELSRDPIGDVLPGAAFTEPSLFSGHYTDPWDTFLTCDEAHNEVLLGFRGASSTVVYVYSTIAESFQTIDSAKWSALEYASYLRSVTIGVWGLTSGDATLPRVEDFVADTSNTRLAGADVAFQPLTGDKNPITLKQWIDGDMVFEGVTQSALTVQPKFDGTNAATAVTAPVATLESHARFGVPRTAALARAIRPGFTITTNGTANPWSLRAMALRYRVVSGESGKR